MKNIDLSLQANSSSPNMTTINGEQYIKRQEKCECMCHGDPLMMHMIACCENGIIYYYEKVQ